MRYHLSLVFLGTAPRDVHMTLKHLGTLTPSYLAQVILMIDQNFPSKIPMTRLIFHEKAKFGAHNDVPVLKLSEHTKIPQELLDMRKLFPHEDDVEFRPHVTVDWSLARFEGLVSSVALMTKKEVVAWWTVL